MARTYQDIISVAALLLLVLSQVQAQLRPPNLSPDNLPDTAFTCEDKVTGGYYADMEADCQLFHVCVQVSEYEFQDFHFLCPNDTVFDQQHLVCTNWFEVDCHAQLAFFSNDFGIKRSGGGGGGAGGGVGEDEDARLGGAEREESGDQAFLGSGITRSRNNGRGQLEVGRRRPVQRRPHQQRRFPIRGSQDYEDLPSSSQADSLHPENIAAITGSTPIPILFTTTVRPSRAAPSSSGFLSGRNLHNLPSPTAAPGSQTQSDPETKEILPFVNFGSDGRKPHVKSNIRAKLANSGRGQRKKSNFNEQEKPRKKAGRKVLQGNRGRDVKFVEPQEDEQEHFTGPEVRPDGRAPRVKANLRKEEWEEDREDKEEDDMDFDDEEDDMEEEERTLAPFVEEFFASPSSPKPFVFTGSKSSAPRLRGADTLLTSSPDESFFIPTVAPEEELEAQDIFSSHQESPAPNTHKSRPRSKSHRFNSHRKGLGQKRPGLQQRKHSRPGQGRGRHRVHVQSTAPTLPEVLEIPEASEIPEVPETPEIPEETPAPTSAFSSSSSSFTSPARDSSSHVETTKPRVKSNQRKRTKFGKSSITNPNTLNSDGDCSNPFHCPPKSTAPGRRPRVKSNLRAKKRNFWQGTDSTGSGSNTGGRRKIRRRGKKQIFKPVEENDIDNDFPEFEDAEATDSSPEEEDDDSRTTQEQFIPTVRTFATKRPHTTTAAEEEEEETDDFEDFFDSGNDLFVASSTVSSVVFKGSPTPGGWASSPAPNFDGSGAQVSFSSPSPYGFGPSGRPSFNNIGAHVDLGPKKPHKILEPEQLFFISSTVSNKIFIGDPAEEEVTTPTTPAQESSSRFSSFPIRGLSTLGGSSGHSSGSSGNRAGPSGLPFRPRKSPFHHFGRNKKTESTTSAPVEKEEEKKEDAEISITTEKPKKDVETVAEQSAPTLTTPAVTERARPRVKSNLFNRRNSGVRNKFAEKLATLVITTPAPAPTTSTTEDTNLETSSQTAVEEEEVKEKKKVVHKSASSRFGGRRPFSLAGRTRPKSSSSNVSIGGSLLSKRKFRGKHHKEKKEKEEEKDDEEKEEDIVLTTLPPASVTSSVFTAFSPSAPSSLSTSATTSTTTNSPTDSVEQELLDDEENIVNEIEPEQEKRKPVRNPLTGFRKPRKWPSVKKAKGKASPANGNIRVEFKKASAIEEEEQKQRKPTFVKPDGRKPRVKANIRARIANRGNFAFGQPQVGEAATGFRHSTKVSTNQVAFDEASSLLALAPPYSGEEEEDEEEFEEDDNTEKREVNTDDTVADNQVEVQDVTSKHLPSQPTFINLPNLQPVILNSRQNLRTGGGNPALPPDVLARIQHITDIHNLPPLPSSARPVPGGFKRSPRVKSDLRRSKQPVLEERIDLAVYDDLEEGEGVLLDGSKSSLLHQLVPSPVISSSSSVYSSSSSSSSPAAPQLSAFRALVQQTAKGDSENSLV